MRTFLACLLLVSTGCFCSAAELPRSPGDLPNPVSSTVQSATVTNQPPARPDWALRCVADENYRLRVGDKVSFQVTEDREPSRMLVIADSGELEFPCVGRLPAAGKSCRELSAEIKTALERDYYYHATVVLALEQANRLLGRVYVWGQVRNQGAVEVLASEQLTAGKAILRAGGFSDFANRKKVKVIRSLPGQNSQVLEVNMADVLEEGRIELDLPLQPDDAVIVGSRVIRF